MMSERRTIRILNGLSTYNLDEFDDRLRLQKLVFIARKMGYDLGYTFTWYARGPYSPSLTRMLFSAHEQGQLIIPDVELTSDENEVVRELRASLQNDIENARMLELIASVWYFLKRKNYSNEEKEILIEKIIQRKPQFTRDEVEEALDRILRFKNR